MKGECLPRPDPIRATRRLPCLCVTEPPSPIARLSLRWRNRNHVDLALPVQMHKRELDPAIDDPAGLPPVLWPCLWSGSRLRLRRMNRFVVEFREPSADSA